MMTANDCGNGYGYGGGYGYGDGYDVLAGGRMFKLVGPDLTTSNSFRWPVSGVVAAQGPFESHDGPCPARAGDGICVGITRAALTSGGLRFSKPNRLLLVEVDPDDVLGSDRHKLRARKVTVVREATPDEWGEL